MIEAGELSKQRTKCAKRHGCSRAVVKNSESCPGWWRKEGGYRELVDRQHASQCILTSFNEERKIGEQKEG